MIVPSQKSDHKELPKPAIHHKTQSNQNKNAFPISNNEILDRAVEDFKLRNQPYDIQVDFMKDMIECFDEKKIGFFESPTGTGKSLSVICSSIAFLRQKNEAFLTKRRIITNDSDSESESSDDDDDDANGMSKFSKLFISTRTHSQIKELVSELRLLKKSAEYLRSSSNQKLRSLESQTSTPIMKTQTKSEITSLNQEIQKCKRKIRASDNYLRTFPRCVSLASRKNLCVNGEYKNLSAAELNDRCNTKCPYYNEKSFQQFSHHIHSSPMDIEDLCRYGESHQVCPYFSCREAIKHSDIVLLPYQTLFQQSTRENMGISVDNSYIVVDEAHNLVDALNALYTVSLTYNDIEVSCNKLMNYRRIISRPPVGDKVLAESTKSERDQAIKNITAVYTILNKISKIVADGKNKGTIADNMNNFQAKNRIQTGNTFSLIGWAKEARLVYKCCHSEKEETDRINSSESLRKCLTFIEMMGYTDDMGKVIISNDQLSYLLLNPSTVFTEVSSLATSTVLVGGTLQPLEDVIFQLTQNKTPEKIMTHCNGHVIPQENCLCVCALEGPDGSNTLFNYDNRNSTSSMDSICQAISDLSGRIPHGMIVFYTSKSYMSQVYNHLKSSQHNYIKTIQNNNKFIVCEESDQKKNDVVMKTFKSHIENNKGGAILFAVINGKLSEGINFANDYCRCVMVVGMPYPDSNDLALQQRKEFFDKKAEQGITQCNGKMFYENICMRAVNQSIGRSFRNINDYAVVILLDKRYQSHSKYLPSWILRSYHNIQNWSEIEQRIDKFFDDMNKKYNKTV
ncbi:helicase [Tritrichomonas foetus]|uniref:Helicase n=1 Tax=Tritrichomonas foetus TaxID=1144522 RepID=A0A1J4KKE0_9EUKA|nr:helicase [Tritrichomonas foetus]|eukprot:OHT10150.1 helicase [Tritrichomonas foetus]